ncbi:hypothetical protein KXS15_29030 [Sinorhizobium meliloti]|uniref:hypothetical protein n=1 Tax=Rhizobium meliloti TaxID=382 RepID=UPI003F1451E0
MTQYTTEFGTIESVVKGGVTVIDGNAKNYVFSNIYEVAANAKPYERVAVAKNFEYVIEGVRAEGTSPWYAAAHDEFVVCMDNEVEVHFVKLDDADAVVDPESEGAHRLKGQPAGQKMGWVRLRRGHMALLPIGAAYQFVSKMPSTLMIQSIEGPETVQKWAEICQH